MHLKKWIPAHEGHHKSTESLDPLPVNSSRGVLHLEKKAFIGGKGWTDPNG
jgi:hypothetical protein